MSKNFCHCKCFSIFFPLFCLQEPSGGVLEPQLEFQAAETRCTGCCVKASTISSRSHMETMCGSWCGREPTSGCTPSSLTRYGGLVTSRRVAYRHCFAIKTLLQHSASKSVYPPLCVSRSTARVWYPVLPRQPAEWQGPPTTSWWTLGASTSWDLLENTDMTEFSRWKEEKPLLQLLTFRMWLSVKAFLFFIVLAHFIYLTIWKDIDSFINQRKNILKKNVLCILSPLLHQSISEGPCCKIIKMDKVVRHSHHLVCSFMN